ncbi:unnamed protein product [Linum trigynum]|uniref:Uncharacterized protein n=1 Tax=Linum trigynum TaxID=586398 RepID=A0AAV2CQR1_9ROSI
MSSNNGGFSLMISENTLVSLIPNKPVGGVKDTRRKPTIKIDGSLGGSVVDDCNEVTFEASNPWCASSDSIPHLLNVPALDKQMSGVFLLLATHNAAIREDHPSFFKNIHGEDFLIPQRPKKEADFARNE